MKATTPPAPVDPPELVDLMRRLAAAYGRPRWTPRGRALDVLVATILSQNTSDVNSERAMAQLVAAFPRWDDVARAPIRKIAAAIQPAGLQQQKARNLRAILRQLRKEHGRASLAFLLRWPTDRIRAYLAALPGVGPKTVACTLLFSTLRRPVLPVDTHIHRVSRRLGLLDPKTSAEVAHEVLAAWVPERLVYAFHVLLIQHGRRVCHAWRPACEACVLAQRCPSAFRAE